MSDAPKPKSNTRAAAVREARLAEQLRANLKRRKSGASKGREGPAAAPNTVSPDAEPPKDGQS